MTEVYLGIDFSGGAAPWRSVVRRPTVWIARATRDASGLVLDSLDPVQNISGEGPPFDRLVRLLADAQYRVAAIDAPLSIPREHLPAGGRQELLQDVLSLPRGVDRPFPTGPTLIDYAASNAPLASRKPLRPCENFWAAWKEPDHPKPGRVINTRSTLWWKPRGGAPFAAACLALIAQSRRPCWPWSHAQPGLLAEAFPAAQLRYWRLPHEKYDGPGGEPNRRAILDALRPIIAIPPKHEATALQVTDALDAVLCVLAAYAVATDQIGIPPGPGVTDGWIAVLERPDGP